MYSILKVIGPEYQDDDVCICGSKESLIKLKKLIDLALKSPDNRSEESFSAENKDSYYNLSIVVKENFGG